MTNFTLPNYTLPISISFKRRIQTLWHAQWIVFPALPALMAIFVFDRNRERVVFVVLCLALFIALRAWEMSKRRQFVRESLLPRFIAGKLREKYSHLSVSDTDLVMRGLRQFFITYLRSGKQFVAMPSQVVDAAWHEFILHTRGYESWCDVAFGKLLHHSPAEVLGKSGARNDGLRRTWFWACKEESIDPRNPSRLPLLFALDKKLNIPGGFTYVPDCKDIDRQSGSGTQCGSDFGSSDGGSGDSGGFGGSESSGSDGGGDSGGGDSGGGDSGGGGCGGGD
jgi:hypothetical protein